MERFQYAYGWMTQWSKSMACVLSAAMDQPNSISLPSVTIQRGVNPLILTEHEVPLIHDELEFLRAKVDNLTAHFEELKSNIETFQFPLLVYVCILQGISYSGGVPHLRKCGYISTAL